jgi:hypothetical protein
LKSVFVALVAVLGLTNLAAAESKTAKIFQLSATGLPKAFKTAPEKLTQVLAQSFGADMSIVPIEDAADILQCSLTARTCLETIASSAAVKRIIFGRIEMRDDKAVIKLTLFDSGKGETLRSFSVTGETTQDLVTALEEALDGAKQAKPAPSAPVIEPKPTPAVPATESRGPTKGTWAMIVVGGISIGAGFAFMASANALRAEVKRAPTDSRQDIDRLIAIERVGKRRVEFGGGLLAIGGVAATVGIVRLVMQRQSSSERPMVDIVPDKGGATVLLTMGWR